MRARVVTAAIGLALLVPSLPGWSDQQKGLPASQIALPDFYPNDHIKVCSLRVDLREKSLAKREGFVERIASTIFDQSSFPKTQKWTYGAVVYGIDYDRYATFYVADRRSCAATKQSIATILDSIVGRERWTTREERNEARLGDYAFAKAHRDPRGHSYGVMHQVLTSKIAW